MHGRMIGAVALFLLGPAAEAAAQLGIEPERRTERPSWWVMGGTVAAVAARGDGFRFVSTGVGSQLFLGVMPGEGPDELRLGFSFSTHADDLYDSRAEVVEVYFEPWWAIDLAPMALRLGPRVAWLREFRDGLRTPLRDFVLGGNLGVRLPLRSRLALESGVTLTNAVFDGPLVAALGPDLDGVVVNWIWQFRLGLIYRFKGADSRGGWSDVMAGSGCGRLPREP